MGWEDSDSEIEVTIESSFDQVEEEKKLISKAPIVSHTNKKKTEKSGVLVKEYDEDEMQQTDAAAEKARLQRLEIRGDMAAADDLFSGFARSGASDNAGSRVREITKIVEKDTFAELQLKTSKEVENFAQRCAQKLKQSKVKSCVFTFLKDVLRLSETTMEVADCTSLAKILLDLEKAKKRAATDKLQNKKKGLSGDAEAMKAGAKVDVLAELDEVYGYSDDEY
jgi:hypothetical protein